MRLIAILVFTIFFISQSDKLEAQNNHELGIRFSNFRDFSAIYKKELSENKFLRIRNVSSMLDYSGISERTGLNIGAAIGQEIRKEINAKDAFIHGPELGVSLRFTKDSPVNSYFRFSYLIGMNHRVGESVIIGIEFIPSFIISGVKENFDYDVLLNFSTVGLTMTYAFETKGKEKSM